MGSRRRRRYMDGEKEEKGYIEREVKGGGGGIWMGSMKRRGDMNGK